MFKTTIYAMGAVSLHYADLTHSSGLFNLWLPLLGGLFLIFLLWEAMFYFSLNNFATEYGFFDMLADVWDLSFDIQDHGLVPAIFGLLHRLLDCALMIFALYHFWYLALGLISQ